ncbi:MAG: hypothetical protein AB7F86_12780 [Bdellovibrionales bacterium]
MDKFATLIQTCDQAIKSGQAHEASRLLAELNTGEIPDSQRLALAKLCRRAGLPSLGLRILGRVVLADRYALSRPPTDHELAEYGVLLQRMGALGEAFDKLRRVNTAKAPEALLYLAYYHFAIWEFEQALVPLQEYLKADLDPHTLSVGHLNLAFALVECRRFEEADPVLSQLLDSESQLVRQNTYALRAQIHSWNGDFVRAEHEISEAKVAMHKGSSNDQFFTQKWRLILTGLRDRDPSQFLKLGELAKAQQAWEVSREADLFSLKVKFDEQRFLRLLFGSPYPGFRYRLSRELEQHTTESTFLLGEYDAPRLDLATGLIDGRSILKPGLQAHQMIEVLTRDLYRPLRVAGLFSTIFPGEIFNVGSSSHRVHQMMTRSRRQFAESGVPLAITESRGFYQLNLTGPFGILLTMDRSPINLAELQFKRLQQAFAKVSAFSAKEVGHALGVSGATVHRLLKREINGGRIERLRGGQLPEFRFKVA